MATTFINQSSVDQSSVEKTFNQPSCAQSSTEQSFNQPSFVEPMDKDDYLFYPTVGYDPERKQWFVAHRNYTRYFNTKEEALEELGMCSVIGYSHSAKPTNQASPVHFQRPIQDFENDDADQTPVSYPGMFNLHTCRIRPHMMEPIMEKDPETGKLKVVGGREIPQKNVFDEEDDDFFGI